MIIPNTVLLIDEFAFYDNLLTSIIIPGSVSSIKHGAFLENPLTSITIGKNVKFADNVFYNEFNYYYNRNRRRAGTYIYINGEWRLQ